MAQKVNLVKDNIRKDGFVGFSWTTFFFGFFVPLFRKDFKSALILFVVSIVVGAFTFGIGSIVLWFIFGFFYNKYYTENLIKVGFKAGDDYSKELLIRNNIFVD